MGLVLATFQEKKMVPILFNFHALDNWGHPNYHNGKENKSQDGGQGKS